MNIIDQAEAALLVFGNLTRPQAKKLLPMWARFRELSRADRRAVLARF